jgi:glycosyltransferase involved in cell wall biosynthesis
MRDMPNYQLEIAGDGDIKDELVALIRRYNLSDRVRLLGRVEPEKLGVYTSRAWLGLNLLEGRSLNYYYSLANKFFDYAQWGVPSVNPAFPEYRKYVARFGGALVLEKVNPSELRKMIFEIEDETDRYENLKAGALAMKEECHWETQIPELEKIYTQVL